MMRSLLFILLISLTTFPLLAQDAFPKGWTGDYQGELLIGTPQGIVDTIPVDFELHEIIPDSSWTYLMTFHSKRFGEIVKDYRILRAPVGGRADFLFDEQNGILMEMTMMNNKLFGMYEVSGTIFISSLQKIGDDLYYELLMAPLTDPLLTQTSDLEEGIFEAKSFKPNQVQLALLKRKN